jgi:simple sugar transport system permease protein
MRYLCMKLPKLKLEKRPVLIGWEAVKISIASIIVAFVVFSAILLYEGANPIDAYANIFSFAFNPKLGLIPTIRTSMFLLFSTLAFILPLKAGLWNVGMEGQLYLGTVGAFAVAYAWGDLPSVVLIPLMLIVAGLFGAGYGAFAGYLKGKLGVNEIVTTLMMNFIGFWLIHFLIVAGPWSGPGECRSQPLPGSALPPEIFGLPFTVFLSLAISVVLYFLLAKSKIGYQIRSFGSSPPAAKHVGISPLKISVFVMAVGGAIAGLSAYHVWAGNPTFHMIPQPEAYKAMGDFTYWGIIVGLLCLLNPLGAIPVSIFIGSIKEGGGALRRRFSLPMGIDSLLLGILFITFVAFQFFYRYRIKRVRKNG